MRGVEKKQNIAINSIYELLKAVSLGTHNNEKEESISADDENYMHVNDVKQLLDQYKELKKLNEKAEEKNKSLLNEVNALKLLKSPGNSVDFEDNNILFEIIEKIDSLKKPSTFNNSVYEIDRHLFDAWISRLIKELK